MTKHLLEAWPKNYWRSPNIKRGMGTFAPPGGLLEVRNLREVGCLTTLNFSEGYKLTQFHSAEQINLRNALVAIDRGYLASDV